MTIRFLSYFLLCLSKMISWVIFKLCCYYWSRGIQMIFFFFFFAMTVIRYNRITDSTNVGLVFPNPHPTEKELETQRERWREKLQESLLTVKSGCFPLSAILLNTSLTLWSNMQRIWMVMTHNEGDDWDGRASSCYTGTCTSSFQILQAMAYLLPQ